MVVHLRSRLQLGIDTTRATDALEQILDVYLFGASNLRLLRALQKRVHFDQTCENELYPSNAEAGSHTIKDTRQHKPPLQISGSQSSRKSRLLCDRIILGSLEGAFVKAFVDTCAENLVTERFLHQRGLSFDPTSSSHVRIADGTLLPTLGTVALHWQFQGEDESRVIRFHVVSSAWRRYPVVLGGAFLWNSGTLTEHTSRLRIETRRLPKHRIFFQGCGHLRLNGICGDRAVEMFPDLASDIPAMSMQFAHEIGVDIDTSSVSRIPVELPGGRMILTHGTVADVSFGLGEDSYQQTFYLIDGLPGDILLDADFLYRTDAFVRYRDHISIAQQTESDGQGVFLAVGTPSKHHWWKPRRKQAPLTPYQQNQKALNDLVLEWTGRKRKLEQNLGAIVAEYASTNDPTKKQLLYQRKMEAEEKLRLESEHYIEEYERYARRGS